MQEERLHLVDTSRRDEDEVEDGEQPELQRECTISDLPESETAEQTGKDVEDHLVPHIVLRLVSLFICARQGNVTYRRPPKLGHQSLPNHLELEPFRCRKVGLIFLIIRVGFAGIIQGLQ